MSQINSNVVVLTPAKNIQDEAMKSFLDRADRITYSNNNDSTLELNLQQRAFQCQQNGEIDQACELYKTAYNEMLMNLSETFGFLWIWGGGCNGLGHSPILVFPMC